MTRTDATQAVRLGLMLVSVLLPLGSTLEAADPPAAAATPPYLNPSLPVPQRVNDLIGRMTVAEKISQLNNDAHAIPRLHVPGYNYWNEALHGVARDGTATVFPQAIGIAATFDTPLIKHSGRGHLPRKPGPSTTWRSRAGM